VVEAIEARQIVPYFQPKLCLKTKRILGGEVLAPWVHPKSGFLPPSAFFQLIDECELCQELLRSLMAQSFGLQRHLYVNGESPTFSYNIEATQLLESDFVEHLIEQVERVGIPLKRISLELPEKSQLSLDEISMWSIMRLPSCGVGFFTGRLWYWPFINLPPGTTSF
jgi:EAL domain-containing protein (putative c-di-GMP-specific phosphodiesterase class I)